MTAKKIMLYGDFTPDRLAGSYQRGFTELGHAVVPFDTRQAGHYLRPWTRGRLAHRATRGSLALRRSGTSPWNDALRRAVVGAEPDLLFILNGEFLMPETLAAIRASGVPVFLFHADNPFPPFAGHRPESIPAARETNIYFIWSRTLATRLRDAGVPRVEYLPFGWDPVVIPYRELSDVAEYEVVFIGGWDIERERLLQKVAGTFPLKIWGPSYWGTRTKPGSAVRRAWQGRSVPGAEAADIVARSRVVLNLLRRQNLPDGTIMRTFEVPGSGSAQLSTRTPGALEIFPEGKAGMYFEGDEECLSRIAAALQSSDRMAMGQQAHHIVSHGHRYVDRARSVLCALDTPSSAATPPGC